MAKYSFQINKIKTAGIIPTDIDNTTSQVLEERGIEIKNAIYTVNKEVFLIDLVSWKKITKWPIWL